MEKVKLNDVCMCSLCKTIYLYSGDMTNCCRDCEKKIITDYREVISNYHKSHPNATIIDIINSDIIKVPDNISPYEFKKIVINAFNLYSLNTTYDRNQTKNYDSALLRDLDERKSSRHIR